MSWWESFFATLIGTLTGGAITWYFAWYYYKKAGDELLVESKKLKVTSDLILYKLQHTDASTELKYNNKGEVSALAVNISAKL